VYYVDLVRVRACTFLGHEAGFNSALHLNSSKKIPCGEKLMYRLEGRFREVDSGNEVSAKKLTRVEKTKEDGCPLGRRGYAVI